MLGKILGAFAGAKAAEHTKGVGGTGGALLGVAAVSLLKRLSLPGLIAVTAGGYAFKKWSDKQAKRKSFETPPAGAAV